MSDGKFGQGRLGRSLLPVLWLGFCWVLIVNIGSICDAAEWSFLPSMSVKGYYNDNLLLTPLPHEATYGYWLSPATEFSGKTERLEVSGRAAVDFVDYYGGERTRFTNIDLPLSVRYKTETDVLGFTGGLTRDNTLRSELLTTGLVLRFTQRNLWTANPTWTRNVTEKLDFQAGFQFSDASYQDGLRLGLTDYQLLGGSAGFLYRLSEKDDVQLTGTYTNFRTVNGPLGLRATYPGATLSFTHAFTESLTGTVYGGPRFVGGTTQTDGDTQRSQEVIWVYGASLRAQRERLSVQLNVTRDIFPSGFGLLITTDRAGMSASYKMTETVTASLDLYGYIVSAVTTGSVGGNFAENRLLYATPRISWNFMEWWKVEVSYSYRWRDVTGFIEPAMSNMATVALTYYPPKLAISQ